MFNKPLKRKRHRNGKLEVSCYYYARIRNSAEETTSIVCLGVTDKQVALEKMSQLLREQERENVGLLPAKPVRQALPQKLAVHVKDYVLNLLTMGVIQDI